VLKKGCELLNNLKCFLCKISNTPKVWKTLLGGIWGELNIGIFRIQERAIRSVIGGSSKLSSRQLFKESNLLYFVSLYILDVPCFIRKDCHSLELKFNIRERNT
jgi:hypothetical protein